jgi:cytoplasmic iron level regulating protein YaaA (DUF328/UPF0246 family)
MLITLSPSKGQDFELAAPTKTYTTPSQLVNSVELVKQLKKFNLKQIQDLMSISENLSELNYQRYKDFAAPFNPQNAKQALFAFKGDVYSGINTSSMQQTDFEYAQQHLRILSGLYGCLKPLDLIQPYRLEMKTKLKTKKGINLYQFWGDSITEKLNASLAKQKHKVLVNLASNEYWKSVKAKNINGRIINVAFKEIKDGKSRIIAIFAKKARGMMADFIIRNRVETIEGLKQFNREGYEYDSSASTQQQMVFLRQQPPPVGSKRK